MRVIFLIVLVAVSLDTAAQAPGGVEDGLRLWLRADQGINVADGAQVLTWADQSGNGLDAVFNPANTFGELPPRFDKSNPGANGKPTVRFNGQHAIELDLHGVFPEFSSYEYTVFVVNARDSGAVNNFYIGGKEPYSGNLILGYADSDVIRFSHGYDPEDLDGTVDPYTGSPDWSIDVFRFFVEDRWMIDSRQQWTREIYRDGRLTTIGYRVFRLVVPLDSGTTLGHTRSLGDASWFIGDIAEVIIYDRALTSAEQTAVESELAARYGRPLELRGADSTWVDTPPTIDGLALEPEWQNSGVFPMNSGTVEVGSLRFLNDSDNLYLFMDMGFDTVDEPSDYSFLFVDLNEDGMIDDEDLLYDIGPFGWCRRELFADYWYAATVCLTTTSEFGATFAASPWAAQPHRIYEMSLDLGEVQAMQGETMRIGIWAESESPEIFYVYPPEVWLDFDRLFEVNLAVQPPAPEAPEQVVATKATFQDRVVVSWSDTSVESSFDVYRCAGSSPGSCGMSIATLGTNVTTYADMGADAGGAPHHYRVEACNSSGCSLLSEPDIGFRATNNGSTISELFNISTRASVGSDVYAVVAGFIIKGLDEKCVVIRSRGQSLDINTAKLIDPTLTLKQAGNPTVLDFNDDWQEHPSANIVEVLGRQPGNHKEAAFYTCLTPGAYTAELRHVLGTDLGLGIVEVIDQDSNSSSLFNISTRAEISTGARRAVAGFIIGGNQPRRVLIRGRGPTVNVPRPLLADPELELRMGQFVVAANDDWVDAPNVAEITATGRAPVEAKEAAILVTLDPGAYTVFLQSTSDDPGIGIIEIIDQTD